MSVASRGTTGSNPEPNPGGVVGLAAVGGAIYLGYLFVTEVLPGMAARAWQVVAGALSAAPLENDFALVNLGYDALVGFGVGVAVGTLRYVFRVRKKVVEDVVDAMAAPGVVSVSKAGLGLAWVLWHGLAGVLAGAVLGWLGLIQFPQFYTGRLGELPGSPGSAVRLLAAAGFFGGPPGGGPPDGGELFLAWLVVLVVAAVAVVLGTVVLTAALAVCGRTLAAGFAGGFAKAVGVHLVLVLTRLWRDFVRRRPPAADLPPVVLEDEIRAFVEERDRAEADGHSPAALPAFLDWLRAKGEPWTVEAARRKSADYHRSLTDRGRSHPPIVRAFVRHLEDRQRRGAVLGDAELSGEVRSFLDETAAERVRWERELQAWREQRRMVLDSYWAWLATSGGPPDAEAALAQAENYRATLDRSDQRALRAFVNHLDVQVRARRPRPVADLPADALPDHVFYPGWVRDALLQALWIGCTTGAVNVLAAGVCMLVAGARLRP